MNRIRLLPEQVANQIAAGEVIERPASVVKELVENALDAGATSILVEIQAGGRSLIRVTDDGTGMSRDDALLCLERHATSKIQSAADLAAIRTMGFRGEALPSIASVSRFQLTTRERDSDSPEGTRVVVHGGKILEVKAAGSAPGTTVEVRQLFYNLPARRKFLRSEETEAAQIQHYLTLAALGYPEVAFRFLKDGRTVWQLAACPTGETVTERLGALRERLRALLGEVPLLPGDYTARLPTLPDEAAPEAGEPDRRKTDFRVWGFIGAPGVSRATRDQQHVFVNRRPVENRGLNFALLEGYHTALMKGQYPVCCLFLEMDPAGVDVNIHPTKREVKFHREGEVRRLVAEAVRKALLGFHGATPSATPAARPFRTTGAASPKDSSAPVSATAPTVTPPLPDFPGPVPPPSPVPPPTTPPLPMGFGRAAAKPQSAVPESAPAGVAPRPQGLPAAGAPGPSPPSPVPTAPVPLLQVSLRVVGVIGRLYLVLESDRGLVLMDQHAAHERILFEQLLQRLESAPAAPAQRLLLPETIELGARDAQFVRENLAALTRLGVGLSEFGERTFLLDALPPFVKVADPRQFVRGVLDELMAVGQSINALRLGEDTIAKTVCRHAVKANDPLHGAELEKLVQDLRRCAMPYTCPHGRPTLIEISYRELEKKFGRVQ